MLPICGVCKATLITTQCSNCKYRNEPDELGISVEEVKRIMHRSTVVLVDVRTPFERSLATLPQSIPIPLHELPKKVTALNKSQTIITYCHHGIRSMHAANYLKQNGYSNVYSMQGGIDAWSAIDQSIPRYT